MNNSAPSSDLFTGPDPIPALGSFERTITLDACLPQGPHTFVVRSISVGGLPDQPIEIKEASETIATDYTPEVTLLEPQGVVAKPFDIRAQVQFKPSFHGPDGELVAINFDGVRVKTLETGFEGTVEVSLGRLIDPTTLTEGTHTILIQAVACNFVAQKVLTSTFEVRHVLRLEYVSGDGHEGAVSSVLPEPLVVKVEDQAGNPVAGVEVSLEVTGWPGKAQGQDNPGASVSAARGTTSGDGTAQTSLTLGTLPGTYTVEARCPQCTSGSPVVFTAMAKGCSGLMVNVSSSEVRPANIGGVSVSSITVGVTQAAPPGGCTVKFDRPVPFSSMGHDHGVHPQDKAGRVDPDLCVIPEGALICPDSPRYIASEIAGQELILALLVASDGGILELSSTMVNIRVPDLVGLSGGEFLEPLPSDRHGFENHYGTSTLVQKVISLALAYHSHFLQKEGVFYELRIGNMSLPWGGLFDIFGNWTIPHRGHRNGIHVDISRHVIDKQGNTIIFGTRQDRLDKIAGQIGLGRRVEESAEECPALQPGEPPCIHYSLK